MKLAEAEPKAAAGELIGDLEAAVMDQLEQRSVARSGICKHHISVSLPWVHI